MLYVVETEDNLYVGRIEEVTEPEDGIVLRTGFQGHPRFIARGDIEAITPAEEHPDVEVLS